MQMYTNTVDFSVGKDKTLNLINFHDVMQIYSVILNTNLNSNLI